MIFDASSYFENAAIEPMGHRDGVSEGELRHPFRVLPELQPAGHLCALLIALHLGHLPSRSKEQEPMNGQPIVIAPDLARRWIQLIAFSVGPVSASIQAM